MSTLKTPEQVAGEVVDTRIAELDLGNDIEPTLYNFFAALNTGWLDASNLESILYSLAIAAINADRAQREEHNPHTLDRFLEVYEGYEGELDHLIHMWEIGQYIPDRIAELTAQWEEVVNDDRAPGEPVVRASDHAYLSVDDWRVGLSWDEAEEIARLIEWQEDAQ